MRKASERSSILGTTDPESLKLSPITPADLSPQDRIRHILAFSLCMDKVSDSDLLAQWPSLDVTEAVVCCERELKIPEVDDELLLRCLTIGDLVRAIQ